MAGRQRKRFFPAVLFALLSWVIVIYFLFFVDPVILRDFPFKGLYFPFFLFLFLALFLTLTFSFFHVRRGLLTAFGIVTFLYLRLFGLGHILNFLLLASFLLILEFAISAHS